MRTRSPKPNSAHGDCSQPQACSAPMAIFRSRLISAAPSTSPASCTARMRSSWQSTIAARCVSSRASAVSTTHRDNGTPYQKNATRLVRYATGADFANPHSAALGLRLYGSDERYHQTFSSISNLPTAANPILRLPLRRNPHALLLRSHQRARRHTPLEPASRRRPAPRRRSRRARRPRLGSRANLRLYRRAHQSPRPSARLRCLH